MAARSPKTSNARAGNGSHGGSLKGIEVRLNNLLLGPPRVEHGWLLFDVRPQQLAVGDNLVGVRLKTLANSHQPDLRVEKLELFVGYHGD